MTDPTSACNVDEQGEGNFLIHEDGISHNEPNSKASTPTGIVSCDILPLATSRISNMQSNNINDSDDKENLLNSPTKRAKRDSISRQSLLQSLQIHYDVPVSRGSDADANHVGFRGDRAGFFQSDSLQSYGTSYPAARSKERCQDLQARTVSMHKRNEQMSEIEQLKQQLATAEEKIAVQEEQLAKARTPQSPLDIVGGESHLASSDVDTLGTALGSAAISGSEPLQVSKFPKAQLRTSYPANVSAIHAKDDSLPPDSNSFVPRLDRWASKAGRNPGGVNAGPTLSEQEYPSPYFERGHLNSLASPSTSYARSVEADDIQIYEARIPRAPNPHTRYASSNSFIPRTNIWDAFSSGESPGTALFGSSYSASDVYPTNNASEQRGVANQLSATANEFVYGGQNGQWSLVPPSTSYTYVPPTEPLNYRRLLDRNVSCNWKYIVDKIVCNNDQQASIFLQQKLKVGTAEQKFEIVEAIVAQAYMLMINRFGNFLVQRCFEHGTPEQVVAIANSIRGNTLTLSMDSFGCHVVQKAFDSVPEEYKALMVHELLRRIPETVIHRYACHVWQKLFELRWNDSPPQIMKYVNEALCGMWHEVALGETGSLVVQNIFENCLEEDKRPCITEVLNSIDVIAHGQFGNWCIQHLCEHGAPADRSKAIDHVLRFATEYSTDQFASKVVEKCLKIGGTEFLERYLERVCEGRPDRPRIPLIDIASDQYGNYLIQYILLHANAQHREIVASHIKKHMVSLRGSKFGSRVGMLCSNPAYAARPGHTSSQSSNVPPTRFTGGNNSNRFNVPFR